MNGSWNFNDFLRQISIVPAAKKRRKPRAHRFEVLEPLAMLTNYSVSISGHHDAAPGQTGSFTISASPMVSQGEAIQVMYSFSGDAADGDLYAGPGEATIAGGASSVVVPVASMEDNDNDAGLGEELTMSLTSATVPYAVGDTASITSPSSASIGVTETGPVMVSLTPATAVEGSAYEAEVTVSGLTTAAPLTLIATASDSHDLGLNVGQANSVTIATTMVTNGTYSFNIQTVDDGADDEGVPSEDTQILTVYATVGTLDGGAAEADITEDNGTTLTPALSVSNASATEGQPMAFTVSYSGMSVGTQINYSTADGDATAPVDYTATSGVTTATAASGSFSVPVQTNDDHLANESSTATFWLTATADGLTSNGVGTITEDSDADDTEPTVSISDAATMEPGYPGTKWLQFTVNISGVSVQDVTVPYRTQNGTAAAGEDYGAQTSSIVFPAYSRTPQYIEIAIYGDAWDPSSENFYVNLSAPANAGLGKSQGVGTIYQQPEPTVSISDAQGPESWSGVLTFSLYLSAPVPSTIGIEYSTEDGSALNGTDYIGATSAWTTIAAGTTTGQILVPLKDDDTVVLNESDQTFSVSLLTLTPAIAAIGNAVGTGTITEDSDPLPAVAISDAVAPERTGAYETFTVLLSQKSAQTITVPYATHDGTATQGIDYGAQTGTVVFPPSQTSATITVAVIDDGALDHPATTGDKNQPAGSNQEKPSDFTVTLTKPANATLARATGRGVIYDGAVPKNPPIVCICTCSCPTVENNPAPGSGSANQHIGSSDPNGGLAKNGQRLPHPVIDVQDELTPGVTGATDVMVQLAFGSLPTQTVYYNAANYTAGQTVDFAQQVDAGSLAPGDYNWTMTVTEQYPNSGNNLTRTYTGSYDVQNLDHSAFGAGWMLESLDQLYVGSGGIDLADGMGNMYWFSQNPSNPNDFLRPAGEPGFSELVKNADGTYTRTDKQGNVENFNSSGFLTSKVDPNGNTTTYTFSGGLIQTITDQAGRTTTFAYTNGLCSSITDIHGRTTTLSYDASGRLLSVTGPNPGGGEAQLTSTFTYDPATGRETTSTNADGTTHYYYDAYGALTKIVGPDGDTTTYDTPQDKALPQSGTGTSPSNLASLVYDSGIQGSQTDGDTHTTTYTTGVFGLVTSSTDPNGQTTSTVYNADGEPLTVTAPQLTSGPDAGKPNVTTYTYDNFGNVIQEVTPDGATQSWTYDFKWNEVTSYTDPMGRVTNYQLDPSNGNVLSMTQVGVNSPDRVTTYTYTPRPSAQNQTPGGLLASETDPRGIETLWSYNSHGLATQVVEAANSAAPATMSYSYNPATDDMLSQTDPLNRTTSYRVDGLGRTVEVDLPAPDTANPSVYPASFTAYDALGRVMSATRLVSEGSATVELVTDYTYEPSDDEDAALVDQEATYGITISAGVTTTTTYSVATHGYDSAENQTSYVDGMGRTTTWQFDALNRQTAQHDPNPAGGGNNGSFSYGAADGPLTSLVYDPLGNVVQSFDANQNETDNAYDLMGNLLSTTGPAPTAGAARPIATFTYNADNEVTSQTDARGGVTQMFYNEFGELVKRQGPSPDGKSPGPITTFSYDPDGNLVLQVDPNGNAKEFIYDQRGNKVEEIDPAPAALNVAGPVWQYSFDLDDELTQTIDPDQRVTQYKYNDDGELTATIAPNLATGGVGDASTTTTDAYDLAGDKTSETSPTPNLSPGVTALATTTWLYDARGNAVEEILPSPDGHAPGPVWQYFYNADSELTKTIDPTNRVQTQSYDGLGRVTGSVAFTGVSTAYSYDALSELTQTTDASGTVTNTYDALGRQTKVVDQANGVTSMGYDLSGNMTSLTDSAGNTTTWQFDHLNRATSKTNPTGTSTYLYDPEGNLVQTVDNDGHVIQYQYDWLDRRTAENWVTTAVTTATPGSGGHSDSVQKIIVRHGASGGDWTLSYNGQTTSAIVYNATAAQVQSALAGVLGAGNVSVTGSGTSGDPFLVTFTGALAGQAALPLTADWSHVTGGAAYDQSDVGVSSVATGQSGTNQTETIGYADSGSAPVNDGQYRLEFNGQLTGSIAFDATATDMQNSLAALANIGAGNVVVTGGPAAGGVNATGAASYQVMFVGALGGQPQPDITVVNDGLYDQNGHAVPTFADVTTPGAAEVDDVQQIVTAPGGTFTLSYNGNATAAQNAGESAATLQTALQAVPGLAQVTVTGAGTAASPYLVTFGGDLKGENVPPLTALGATLNSIATTYDNAGQITSVGDNYSHYAYTYDGQGNTASVDNAGSPYSPRVVLASQYDAAGNRESLAATLYNGSTAEPDFINNYSYDALSRLTVMQQQQQNQPGADAVASKEIDYAYNGLGEVTSRADFNFIGVGPRQDMATGNFTYDSTTGLLTGLDYTSHGGATAIDNFNWTYDTLARVKTFSSIDGTATYGYDSRSEVTSAGYTTSAGGHQPANESFSFDANGNRPVASGGTVINNEVSDDGTFKYTFDADGNRLTRTRDSAAAANDYQVSYTYDYRNRLVEVRDFNNTGTLTEQIDYTYDVFDHLIQRVDDVIGGSATTTQYIWDNLFPLPPGEGQGEGGIVLSFTNGALAARYLNGPNTNAADQYFTTLAEEHVTSLVSPGNLTFDLPDNEGTLRDVADASGNPADHLVYTVFGQLAYESTPTVSHIDGYAGGLYDPSTQLVYYIHRWYDPAATVWISADPLGFAAGDANLTRYVANESPDLRDPSGLWPGGNSSRYQRPPIHRRGTGPRPVPNQSGPAPGRGPVEGPPRIVPWYHNPVACSDAVDEIENDVLNRMAWKDAERRMREARRADQQLARAMRRMAQQAGERDQQINGAGAPVTNEEAQEILQRYGRRPYRANGDDITIGIRDDYARDFAGSCSGQITIRLVRRGEQFVRYSNYSTGRGSFLTKTEYDSPEEAVEALYLRPYNNRATYRQRVVANADTYVLEGDVACGTGRQTIVLNPDAFDYYEGSGTSTGLRDGESGPARPPRPPRTLP